MQTSPAWFAILRLFSPLEPFLDKTWRVSEIEEVRSGNTGSFGWATTVTNH